MTRTAPLLLAAVVVLAVGIGAVFTVGGETARPAAAPGPDDPPGATDAPGTDATDATDATDGVDEVGASEDRVEAAGPGTEEDDRDETPALEPGADPDPGELPLTGGGATTTLGAAVLLGAATRGRR